MGKHLEVILSGFGGQGILSGGYLLAYAGMIEDMHVSWLPSYGPEMRGGTANCNVIVSDKPVGSPIITNATALIAMNTPSFAKFERFVEKGGFIIYDSSLADAVPSRSDVVYCGIPATRLATDMGNLVYANMILLGKLVSLTDIFSMNSIISALSKILPEKKHHLIPDNIKALESGSNY